jgi:hypothetical protein
MHNQVDHRYIITVVWYMSEEWIWGRLRATKAQNVTMKGKNIISVNYIAFTGQWNPSYRLGYWALCGSSPAILSQFVWSHVIPRLSHTYQQLQTNFLYAHKKKLLFFSSLILSTAQNRWFLTFILPGGVFKFYHMVYDKDECCLTTKSLWNSSILWKLRVGLHSILTIKANEMHYFSTIFW